MNIVGKGAIALLVAYLSGKKIDKMIIGDEEDIKFIKDNIDKLTKSMKKVEVVLNKKHYWMGKEQTNKDIMGWK